MAQRSVIGVVTVVAAGLGALADTAPTGLATIDAVERAGFAALVVLAGSTARRWAMVVGPVVVAVAGDGWYVLAGFAGIALTGVLVAQDRRSRVLGAVTGGLVAVGVLHLGDHGRGLGAVLALAAAAPVLASGYANAPRLRRRRVRLAVAVVVGAVCVVLTGVAALGIQARHELSGAVAATSAGVRAAERGEQLEAEAHFLAAADAFDDAEARFDVPWSRLVDVVPVASQNLRAVRQAAAEGSEISAVAARNAGRVDYDRLALPRGGVDLDVLRAFEGPVADAHGALRASAASLAEIDSPLLVGPIASRVREFRGRVDAYRRELALVELGVTSARPILGGEGERRYLVLLGNPAEARDLGGHIGNWAELTLDRGRIDLVEVGEPADLALPPSDAPSDHPAGLLDLEPRRYPQNWGGDPDLATVARLSAELFVERTGRTLDGVLYADPRAFAAFVALTGPVPVPGLDPPTVLTSADAEKFLVADQFERFDTEGDANDGVSQLVEDVFDELTGTQLPRPQRLATLFAPLVDEGRFSFFSLHDEDHALLDRLGMEGRVPDPGDGDLLGIVTRNANPSKIDAYLRRDATAEVRWDPATGAVSTDLTIRLTNLAPSGGLDPVVSGNALGLPPGTNAMDLAVLTPLELASVTIDGEATGARPVWDGRHWRHTVRVTIPPGGERTVRFGLEGSVAPGPVHRLAVVGQPLVNDGTVRIHVRPSDGAVASGDGVAADRRGGATASVPSDRDRTLTFAIDAA
ncbi:MAG TPA: DUF4012 domain-containing protein [Aquihabitans sp.]|jgi:hypothetical protein|nr:DUF4012 domain-containing protein [Aquihabitans sp.]